MAYQKIWLFPQTGCRAGRELVSMSADPIADQQLPNLPQGSGPGQLTPDGCAVELYSQLPPQGEPQIVAASIPADSVILELGAGTGRITHPLLQMGYRVIAVDESREMLDHVHGAELVHRPIEDLDLGRRVDAVLMMSYLVATPDRARRLAWLQTCRRHIDNSGQVILQRHSPHWFDTAQPYKRAEGSTTLELISVERPGPGLLTVTMRYTIGDRQWTHSFTHDRWNGAEMTRDLAAADLSFVRFLTDDEGWIEARAA